MPSVFLESVRKKNKRYEVIINDGVDSYSFEITEDLLVEFRFISPREVSFEDYQKFLNKLPLDELIFRGESYLLKKIRSKKEVKEYLRGITNSNELIDEAVEVLEKKNLINDEYYFECTVEYLVNVKRDGYRKIVQELEFKGLDSSKFIYRNEDLRNNIQTIIKKVDKTTRGISKEEKIIKIKRHLLQKGYREDEINRYFNYSLVTDIDN